MVTPVALPPEGAESEHLVGGIPLASLVRDFHRPMVNFARTMVNSTTVAEEAVQEAWVQVLQSSGSFEGRSSVRTWLFGIVKNTAINVMITSFAAFTAATCMASLRPHGLSATRPAPESTNRLFSTTLSTWSVQNGTA